MAPLRDNIRDIFSITYFAIFTNRNRALAMKRKLNSNEAATSSTQSYWSADLIRTMNNPENKVKEDATAIVIKDKYPKAEFHYLILPKEDIANIWSVRSHHEKLLTHMHDIAIDLIKEHPDREFIMGYHAVPSMQRLHLHVISTDFISSHLQTKYHWNSFTTPFFLHSSDVCQQLCETGEIKRVTLADCKVYLDTKLKCHKCSEQLKTMPELKRHLSTHVTK